MAKKGYRKYKAQKVHYDDYCFDSQAEYRRYLFLKDRLEKGEIEELRVHVRYTFVVKQSQVGTYEADFVYFEKDSMVVEDVKGYINPGNPMYQLFKMKVALMKACNNIDVVVVLEK